MLLLVDYSSLLFRTFHTIPSSVPMHAVFGFLNMLARLIGDRRPDALGIGVDEDWRPAFRVDAIPAYKAHRVSDEPDPIEPQDALGREVLEALLASRTVPPAIARRLEAARDYLAAARRVVLPVTDIPLEAASLSLPATPADPGRLTRLADEHQLGGPAGRLTAALAARAARS